MRHCSVCKPRSQIILKFAIAQLILYSSGKRVISFYVEVRFYLFRPAKCSNLSWTQAPAFATGGFGN